MDAIVLAGGLGTRLGNKTKDIPKPMLPVGGRPFLEFLLDFWISQGITHFILGVGYKHEVIQSHFGETYKGVQISYSIEEELLGTGGGLLLALDKLKSPDTFLAVNGDTFFEVSLKELKEFHEKKNADCSMTLFKISAGGQYEGIKVNAEGRVESVLGRDKKHSSRYANGGVYLMTPELWSQFAQRSPKKISLERDLFPELVKQGRRVFGFSSEGRFIDIGTPDDYERSAQVLNSLN